VADKSNKAVHIPHLARELAAWFEQHRRPLPFRQHYDPYECWLAEVIFQQTRIEQGMPYYRRFLEKYPTVHQLAEASEEEVLNLWQGLGYYRRALNLLEGARQVVQEHQGKIPVDRTALLRIKGIGQYIASAVRAIAFNRPDVVIDGNVRRVMGRWFALEMPIDTPAAIQRIRDLGALFLRHLSPRLFNEALMEFGALQCTPRPRCETCPMQPWCMAFQQGRPTDYPRRKARRKPTAMPIDMYRLTDGRRIWLVRQDGDSLWKGLYLFPYHPKNAPVPYPRPAQPTATLTHVLTHRRIQAALWDVHLPADQLAALAIPAGRLVPIDEIHTYPLPRLMEKVLAVPLAFPLS